MSHHTPIHTGPEVRPRRTSPRHRLLAAVVALTAVAGACAAASAAPAESHAGHTMRAEDRVVAMRASAGFQDVAVAEGAGYASSIGTLGCFQNPELGGMGVHYIDGDLLDATLDITQPEALVYELDASGEIAGLVGHEYIVPIDAWTSRKPPTLFGMELHRHPTLPLWVLHTWLWKDNPAGVFEDWNPAVRLCPAGVPIFGTDLPAQ
jgi:hypothetical protein